MPEVPRRPDGAGAPSVSLLRNLSYLTSSTAFIRLGGFAYAILIRRVLGPTAMGAWNTLEIAINYLAAVTVGISYSSERLIPGYLATGQEEKERTTRNTLLTWTILELIILAIAIELYVVVLGNRHSPDVQIALRWLPLLLCVQKLLSVYLVLFKSTRQFRTLSIATAAAAVLDWTLLVWATVGGFRAMLAGALVSGAIKVALYHRFLRPGQAPRLTTHIGRETLQPHFPYALRYAVFKAAFTVVERIDPLFVGMLLGTTALGYYYLGHSIARLSLEVPAAVSYLAFPNLVARHAIDRPGFSREYFKFLRLDLFVVLPLLLPLVFFGADVLIRHVVPAFAPGIPSARIIVATVSLLAVRLLIYQVLMCFERVGTLTWITAIQIPAFFAAFVFLAPWIPDVLIRAAIANYVATAIHTLAGFLAIRPLIDFKGEAILGHWMSPLLICVAWSVLLMGVAIVWPFIPGNLLQDITCAAVRVLLVWTIALPVSLLGLRQYRGKLRDLFAGLLRRS